MDAMREHGLHETISFIFTRAELVELVGDVPVANAVALANPMRAEASLLRTHMLPGLLDALAINHARHAREVALFERGRVYAFAAKDVDEGPTAAADRAAAGRAHARRRAALAGSAARRGALARCDARGLGAVLVERSPAWHEARVSPARAPVSWLHPGAQAEIAIGEDVVGRFGRVHPALSERWDLPAAIAPVYGELWLERVPGPRVPVFTAPPRFPSTARDVSLDLAATVPAATVVDAIHRAHAEVASAADDRPRPATGDRATSRSSCSRTGAARASPPVGGAPVAPALPRARAIRDRRRSSVAACRGHRARPVAPATAGCVARSTLSASQARSAVKTIRARAGHGHGHGLKMAVALAQPPIFSKDAHP